jgi:hypothetical protein
MSNPGTPTAFTRATRRSFVKAAGAATVLPFAPAPADLALGGSAKAATATDLPDHAPMPDTAVAERNTDGYKSAVSPATSTGSPTATTRRCSSPPPESWWRTRRTRPAHRCAGLAGQALTRAHAFDAEHELVGMLQRSLLPRRLPKLPGGVAEARYLPTTEGLEVGGDWYDVIPPRTLLASSARPGAAARDGSRKGGTRDRGEPGPV